MVIVCSCGVAFTELLKVTVFWLGTKEVPELFLNQFPPTVRLPLRKPGAPNSNVPARMVISLRTQRLELSLARTSVEAKFTSTFHGTPGVVPRVPGSHDC